MHVEIWPPNVGAGTRVGAGIPSLLPAKHPILYVK